MLQGLGNPYYLGDEAAGTQTSGWLDGGPDGLFTTHHGIGSEEWSADSFTRI